MTETIMTAPELESPPALKEAVKAAAADYLNQPKENVPKNLYQALMDQIEEPLLRFLMDKTKNNQCEVTRILGIARGTVRKKLARFDLL